MGKEKEAAANPFFRGLLQWGLYKRTQGRITRQVTFAALAITFLIAAYRLHVHWQSDNEFWQTLIPTLVAIVGIWLSYRLVNLPSFADFLISVEAEMYKMSWPARGELFRSSVVVILVIFGLAFILLGYDLLWRFILSFLGIHGAAGNG
ncbi:MAG TPA: preprotein translocase subunit SecE [Pirellulales bacterium]|jgi:preprotein translocase subunit SecE|nr:preprotein translocase subunit SecE [Pirellulales bacterium]